jgi:hypothetical protein
MDDFTKLMPLWSASKPEQFIYIADRPDWDCIKCQKNFWKEPTKVKVATEKPFGGWRPLSVWVATSECFVCGESHNWLLDPDKPVAASTKDSSTFGKLLGEHAVEQGKIERGDDDHDDRVIPLQDLTVSSDELTDWQTDDSVPYSEWCKQFGESDLKAYIRWLKSQRKSRDGDDPNDAS